MNWTGGHLHRHATESAKLKNRQKQHFAKAQQNLRRPVRNQSPIKILSLVHPSLRLSGSKTSLRQPIPPCGKDLQISSKIPQVDPENEFYKIRSDKTSQFIPVDNDVSKFPKEDMHSKIFKKTIPISLVSNLASKSPIEASKINKELVITKKRILMKTDWAGILDPNLIGMKSLTKNNQKSSGKNKIIADNCTTKKHVLSPLMANEYHGRKGCKMIANTISNIQLYRGNSSSSMHTALGQHRRAKDLSTNCAESEIITSNCVPADRDEFSRNSTSLPYNEQLTNIFESSQVVEHYDNLIVPQRSSRSDCAFTKLRNASKSSILHCSSSALLQHPTPQNSKLSSLILPFSSGEEKRGDQKMTLEYESTASQLSDSVWNSSNSSSSAIILQPLSFRKLSARSRDSISIQSHYPAKNISSMENSYFKNGNKTPKKFGMKNNMIHDFSSSEESCNLSPKPSSKFKYITPARKFSGENAKNFELGASTFGHRSSRAERTSKRGVQAEHRSQSDDVWKRFVFDSDNEYLDLN